MKNENERERERERRMDARPNREVQRIGKEEVKAAMKTMKSIESMGMSRRENSSHFKQAV